jgi:hypothetical protein
MIDVLAQAAAAADEPYSWAADHIVYAIDHLRAQEYVHAWPPLVIDVEGVVLGGGRAARSHRRRRALHGDGAVDEGAVAQYDRCLRRPRHERARSAVPDPLRLRRRGQRLPPWPSRPDRTAASVSRLAPRARGLDRRLGLAPAGVDDPPADVDCQRSAKAGLWARRRLDPRGRSEGRFAPRLPHGFDRRRQEVGGC